MRKSRTVDGYIRVSRRGGREGDGFISPQVQRERIQAWADASGVEVVRWWEEIDQTGARRERPMFQESLARCERGETGGIVVAKLDRFARSAVDALESIKRLNDAGARLVSVEDGFDGSTAMGRIAIGILTLIAELELERIRENWATAVSEAVGRGIHISARVPTGYRRDENRRLVVVKPAASAVRGCFRRRATGASWASLARYLEEQQVFCQEKRQLLHGLLDRVVPRPRPRAGSAADRHPHPDCSTRNRASRTLRFGVPCRLPAR